MGRDDGQTRQLVIENLALRQQVTALKQARPRPRLDFEIYDVPHES